MRGDDVLGQALIAAHDLGLQLGRVSGGFLLEKFADHGVGPVRFLRGDDIGLDAGPSDSSVATMRSTRS
jgi:hypothetical protein